MLKGVGPRRAQDLAAAGILTVGDFLCRLPRRYEDRSRLLEVSALEAGQSATVCGRVARCGLRRTRRRGFTIFELMLQDDTGEVLALWFNQPYLRDVFTRGQRVMLHGKAEARGARGLQLLNPQHELLGQPADASGGEDDPPVSGAVHAGRIVPVYEKLGSLTARVQRSLTWQALAALPGDLDDPLPEDLRRRLGLPARREALAEAHFPAPGTDPDALAACATPAQQRLVFDELFLFQLGVALRRRTLEAERKPFVVRIDDRVRAASRAVLPFPLTAGQRAAVAEIVGDMRAERPMNRLLQGDVGVGKTIVALIAALVAIENGLQVAFMAPTEILAEQHYGRLRSLLAPTRHRAALLTGAAGARRRDLQAGLARGDIGLVVGTHALVQGDVAFARLGLAIVDEQHRFGVAHRAALRAKGLHPDVLVMTATPIPRTLALALYGDLDVSTIRERPPGRACIRTAVRPESRRAEVYDLVRRELTAGRQAYVVYPLIDESEKVDLRAAVEMADHLRRDVFPDLGVGLLHGRMPRAERERVMAAFAAGRLGLLVATTVVEVGIDVPNATVIVIEHAERFGLAQLHQLRGRVGRGPHPSTCVLLHQPGISGDARTRLRALAETDDGFEIADRDLALRGPGDVIGTRQSGLPMLRVADLVRDQAVLERARREATAWVAASPPDAPLAELARRAWSGRFGLAGVG